MKNVLWIDDMRDPAKFIASPDLNITWKDTYTDAEQELRANGLDYDEVWFDNDLGDEQFRQGKHLFNILEELFYFHHNQREINLKAVYVHSDNSSAVHSMMLAKDIMKGYGVTMQQRIFKSN